MDKLEGGLNNTQNEKWIAKKHVEFWHECTDLLFRFVDLATE